MLRCDPNDWGLPPAEYARREKAKLRARVRARMQAERDMRRSVTAPSLVPSFGAEVFETASGILAYRKTVPNRLSLTSQPVAEATATTSISLPYVSILGRPS